jgi:hypothetical protein
VRNIDQKENMFIYQYIYMFIYLSFAVNLNVPNFVFQTDDIGDVYQDEENMAALLVQRDAKNGGILVVSSALSTALSSALSTALSTALSSALSTALSTELSTALSIVLVSTCSPSKTEKKI